MANSFCQYVPNDVRVPGLPTIYTHELTFSFQESTAALAVENASIGIAEHQITAIIGESGSGKSTLLRLIYGLLEPTSGEVRYKGWRVPTRKDKLIPGHDAMKLVSQGFDDLNTYANVWDNIASQLSNTDLRQKEEKTKAILEKLRILHLSKKRVADISGGEKQRVAIARALVNDPEVLLMDEPFNQVDASFRDTLQQDIRTIVDETGLTVVLVSHDPTEVLALADDLIVMKAGKVIDQNSPHILYNHPTQPYTAQLLAKSNILSGSEAATLGISAHTTIAIHQEWISVERVENTNTAFTLKRIRFRGFYNELVLSNGTIDLHAIINATSVPDVGTPVRIAISNWISFA